MKISTMPKISLHDHLDGGLRPETIIDIAQRDGIDLPEKDPERLATWFVQSCSGGDLSQYLKTFELTTAVMQTREDLIRVAHEYVLDLHSDGVIYGEVRWAPEQHTHNGMTMAEAVHAVQTGIDRAVLEIKEGGSSIQIGQILCAMRQNNNSLEVAGLALQLADAGVVGFDLAGPEADHSPDSHEPALRLLAENHFPTTLHAGEEGDLKSVRSAVFNRALRLGHGTKLALDVDFFEESGREYVGLGSTIQWVRDRGIGVEVCLSSNLQTGSSPWGNEAIDHPFDLFYSMGILVSVNCDNRLMSGTTLTRELAILSETFGYDETDMLQLQINAAQTAFLPLDERAELIATLEQAYLEG